MNIEFIFMHINKQAVLQSTLLNVRLMNTVGIVLAGGWYPLLRVDAVLLDSRLSITDRWMGLEGNASQ